MPRMLLSESAPELHQGFLRIDAEIRRGPLDATVRELVKLRASQLNGCVFCVDLHSREALKEGEHPDRLHQLPVWEESERFEERERAALAYTDAVTGRRPVDDALWQRVCEHFPDEAERAHLIAQVSLINALNLYSVPLRMRPRPA
ncbi:carboxymuconolactone decarboxylase family protein [Streptomyces aidingensis]|uniref:Alkylhydroperoxidase AhpD family core domain-containing protein n=1 Tax=Streptomyces aidingensis TaxID=910347 RepID=A0A1I1QWB9_9ACTN|nr:carboxymuconolactone decarboxylase family protein [Streptomyces aidingensis]SFD26292.1 alkylhydroperoxidase AhpD family core domain-containing protein [Streptomyces aidingensis]